MNNKIRIGMIGGGPGAFIGAVHRIAFNMDGMYQLVCGAFSSDGDKSKAMGSQLGLLPQRVYNSYDEMIEQESALPVAERMQAVSIVTPNHVHFEPAKRALEKGFHVILDKPMTHNLPQALELKKIADKHNLLFCLTHTYTGYPMVKEAKQIVASGALGHIRKIYVEYPQGWLSTFLESGENKQAAWRTDPERSGKAGAIGDIGTHAFNLAEYVSGLQVTKICADINTVVDGRKLDDDGAILLKFNNGASGVLVATQVAAGSENNVSIRVYGEKGGLEWEQENNNSLTLTWLDKPAQVLRCGNGYLHNLAKHNSRTPPGHPEGYLEAFANLYRNVALCIDARENEKPLLPEWLDFPGINEGVRGMAFIENAIASGLSDKKWTDFTY